MRLLEYEAKKILADHGCAIPESQLITDADRKPRLAMPQVLKVQIPIGGRGKAGGIKTVKTSGEFSVAVEDLLSRAVLGHQAKTLLAEQALDIQSEFYLSITLDRAEQSLALVAHNRGGVDIEQAAAESAPTRIPLQAASNDDQIAQLSNYLKLTPELVPQLKHICQCLWQICLDEDALLVEINPLVLTNNGHLVCADAKIELDDSASFRHDWSFEQKPTNTQFVILDEQGTVGSMANGAGLAMATVDAIKAAGVEPANFLDVGGGTNTAGMVAAFGELSRLPDIHAIIVNIFGGITRCDEVAQAIVEARRSVINLPPLFIRLTGTNERQGHGILASAGISALPDLASCVQAAALVAKNA